jgi:hypothetical protein
MKKIITIQIELDKTATSNRNFLLILDNFITKIYVNRVL